MHAGIIHAVTNHPATPQRGRVHLTCGKIHIPPSAVGGFTISLRVIPKHSNMDSLLCLSCLLFILISCCLIQPSLPETILGEYNDEFDFDGLPGVQHEFKVDIKPGREECFYQMIKNNAQLHISFQVLRGADRNVDMVIKKPDGNILDSHLWTHEGSTDREVDMEGIYAFCIDNTFSRFSSKLVYVFLVTYVVAEWEQFTQDLQDFDISIANFTDVLQNVARNINKMFQVQGVGRQYAVTDWYVISTNNQHIQHWSLLMCAVIMATGGLQVFFVRRLFMENSGTAKPRA